jgi:SAM-dependent methyltransferase
MSFIGPGYQPLFREGEPQVAQRDVLERWELLEPLLPYRGVMVDVGSNYGWFGLRACMSRPELHVISVEPDVDCLSVQSDLVEEHELWDRMHLFSEPLEGFWVADIVDRVDLVLMLSVLHWFADPERVVREAAAVSDRIVFDYPDIGNTAAHNRGGRAYIGHIVDWLNGLRLGDVQVVGRVPHHVSEHDSWLVQLSTV